MQKHEKYSFNHNKYIKKTWNKVFFFLESSNLEPRTKTTIAEIAESYLAI